MTRNTTESRSDLVPAAAIVAANAIVAVTWARLGVERVAAQYFPDDAFFYPIIARNVVAGFGPTTDQIAHTNGVQPLWQLVAIVLSAISAAPVTLVVLLNCALAAASTLLLFRYAEPLVGRPSALLVALVVATEETYVFSVLHNGMESALAFPLLLLCLLSIRNGCEDARSLNRLSLALAFLFFARLDGGLFWISLAATVLGLGYGKTRGTIADRARLCLRIFIAPSLVVSMYLLANLHFFGSPMPISGEIKATTALGSATGWAAAQERIRFAWALVPSLFGLYTAVRPLELIATRVAPAAVAHVGWVWVAIVCLASPLLVRRAVLLRTSERPRDPSIAVLVGFLCLHVVYYGFFQGDTYSVGRWARVPEMLWLALVIGVLISWAGARLLPARLAGGPRTMAFATAGIGFALLVASRRLAVVDPKIQDFSVDLRCFDRIASAVSEYVPPDSPIITRNIGFLGYFTQRRVVSFDGLANSREYLEHYLRRHRVVEYMREHEIRFIVDRANVRSGSISDSVAMRYPPLRPSDLDTISECRPSSPDRETYALLAVRSWP